MRFRFRLETALRLAHHEEEQAKVELGRRIAAVEEVGRRISLAEEEISEETALQREARGGEVWSQGQMLYLEWIRSRKDAVVALRAEESLRRTEAEAARVQLVAKRRAVEVLERLRERRLAQWKLERSRRELAEGSDVAARRWMRDRAASAAVAPRHEAMGS